MAFTMLAGCIPLASAQLLPEKAQSQPILSDEPQQPASIGDQEAQLRSSLKKNPNSAELLYQLAAVQRLENKPRDSLETYTHAASLKKPDVGELRSVALDYVLLNDYKDAIYWLRVALSMDADSVDVLYSLGRCLYSENLFSQAEDAFTRVLRLRPDHLKAEENLGLTYEAENDPQKAEAALRTAAGWAEKLPPRDEWPFLDLGRFLLDENRAGEALPFLEKAAEIAPNSALCQELLGRAEVATGDTAGGIKSLESAVSLDPKNPKIHFELGHAYRDAGQADKARAEFAISKSLYGEHSQN
jgi:cytochrome c-type biogenesis protein CcmH/NrfG